MKKTYELFVSSYFIIVFESSDSILNYIEMVHTEDKWIVTANDRPYDYLIDYHTMQGSDAVLFQSIDTDIMEVLGYGYGIAHHSLDHEQYNRLKYMYETMNKAKAL